MFAFRLLFGVYRQYILTKSTGEMKGLIRKTCTNRKFNISMEKMIVLINHFPSILPIASRVSLQNQNSSISFMVGNKIYYILKWVFEREVLSLVWYEMETIWRSINKCMILWLFFLSKFEWEKRACSQLPLSQTRGGTSSTERVRVARNRSNFSRSNTWKEKKTYIFLLFKKYKNYKTFFCHARPNGWQRWRARSS